MCDTDQSSVIQLSEMVGLFGTFYINEGIDKHLAVERAYQIFNTDSKSRTSRENYCCEVIPSLLINSREVGIVGGDLNCIIDKRVATH